MKFSQRIALAIESTLLGSLILLTCSSIGHAQQIPDRTTLDGLLGPGQVLDDFEAYVLPVGGAEWMNTSTLTSTTIVNGQGPGLVHPGVTYRDPSGARLQWNDDQYHAITTRTILGETQQFDIVYSPHTQACGFDLTNFATYNYTGSATFVDGSGAVIGVVNLNLGGGAGERQFAGWQHVGGIARVEISSPTFSWSPIIDDHGYGTVGSPGDAFCFGDASGANCPCSAFGGSGQGCSNTGGMGATLTAMGFPSLASDTLQFDVAGVPGSKPGLILRGDNPVAIMAGDGILCTSGNSQRSHVQLTNAGSTTFTDFNGMPFGAVANLGAPTNFQFWYRDPSNTCSGAGFNFSNGWSLTYVP